jgi:hypothetical protein
LWQKIRRFSVFISLHKEETAHHLIQLGGIHILWKTLKEKEMITLYRCP